MSVGRKAKAVERIFESVDREIGQFKTTTGLNCLNGCGACCTKPDIEASMLEFLPLALHLFRKGELDHVLNLLDSEPGRTICVLFSPVIAGGSAGFCSRYKYRGLICRLFGFAASKDKSGSPSVATCRKIKDAMPEIFQKANHDIKQGLAVPIISEYYLRLYAVDPNAGSKMLPVNEAIRQALEIVALYFFYKNPKAS